MRFYLIKTHPIKLSMILLVVACLLSACNRFVPEIAAEVLQQKKSILVITSPSVNAQVTAELSRKLKEWREVELIAYEWTPQVASISDALIEKIKKKQCDEIIIMGNDLFPSTLNAATLLQDKKWVLLQDDLDHSGIVAPKLSNVMYYQIDPALLINQWSNWVNQQVSLQKSIFWVTDSSHPIPALWAPSEEADHVFQRDIQAEDWYSQLSFQTKATAANWIALYYNMDNADLQKVKTLHIPIVDFAANEQVTLNWGSILANQLTRIKTSSWHADVINYREEEATVEWK